MNRSIWPSGENAAFCALAGGPGAKTSWAPSGRSPGGVVAGRGRMPAVVVGYDESGYGPTQASEMDRTMIGPSKSHRFIALSFAGSESGFAIIDGPANPAETMSQTMAACCGVQSETEEETAIEATQNAEEIALGLGSRIPGRVRHAYGASLLTPVVCPHLGPHHLPEGPSATIGVLNTSVSSAAHVQRQIATPTPRPGCHAPCEHILDSIPAVSFRPSRDVAGGA